MSDKKQANGKKLRAFKVETLSANELRQVTGGIYEMLTEDGGTTAATRSFCHVDGVDDGD